MIKLFLLVLFIQVAWGRISMEIKPERSEINQGEIFSAALILREGSAPISSLSGKSFGNSIYVVSIGPFIKKDEALEAQARLIFTQVPKANQISEPFAGDELLLSWQNLKINPTDAQSFLLGNFEIPARFRIFFWILWIAGITSIFILGFLGYRRWKTRSEIKRKRRELWEGLLKARSYEDIVAVWKSKHLFLKSFPEVQDSFHELEATLFKYIFRPSISASEIEKVVLAYEEFKAKIAKGANGI